MADFGTSPPLWEPIWEVGADLEADMAAGRVHSTELALDSGLSVARDPRVLLWCMHQGLGSGHVVVLYKLARNALKWRNEGSVPTPAQQSQAAVIVLLLLLRVAQDVQANVTDLARPSLMYVYTSFLAKVRAWVLQWPPAMLPPLRDAVEWVLKWSPLHDKFPNPAWVAAFKTPKVVGIHFTFDDPSTGDVRAMANCKTLDETRALVRDRLRAALLDGCGSEITWALAFERGGLNGLVCIS